MKRRTKLPGSREGGAIKVVFELTSKEEKWNDLEPPQESGTGSFSQ
jgi:hypothetical protein